MNATVAKYPKGCGLGKFLGCHALFFLDALAKNRPTKRELKQLTLSILERFQTKTNNFPITPSSSSNGKQLETSQLCENPSEVRCIT